MHASAIPVPWAWGPQSEAEVRLWAHVLGAGKTSRLRQVVRSWFAVSPNAFRRAGGLGNITNSEALSADGAKDGGTDPGSRYAWLYPTADFQNFDKYGTSALGAVGVATNIGATAAAGFNPNGSSNMPFLVPNGFNGFIKTLAIDFVANAGAAWTQGVIPQQLQFGIFVDNKPVADYGAIAYSPGLVIAPTAIAGIPIKEGNQVTVQVTNLTLANTTQFVEARLQGYYYGKQYEPKEMWQ